MIKSATDRPRKKSNREILSKYLKSAPGNVDYVSKEEALMAMDEAVKQSESNNPKVYLWASISGLLMAILVFMAIIKASNELDRGMKDKSTNQGVVVKDWVIKINQGDTLKLYSVEIPGYKTFLIDAKGNKISQ